MRYELTDDEWTAIRPMLPNVIASPQNSAQGDGAHDISLRRAV
ncbi:MAG: hypothetical protein ACLPKT_15650 [Methylocella sp.]